MGAVGIVALIIQLIVVFVVLLAWFAIAILPGSIARKRGHPQADAITAAGWCGAITMGLLSPLAFIWAYTKPVMQPIEVEPAPPPEPAEPDAKTDEEAD